MWLSRSVDLTFQLLFPKYNWSLSLVWGIWNQSSQSTVVNLQRRVSWSPEKFPRESPGWAVKANLYWRARQRGIHKRESAGRGYGHCFVTGSLTRDSFQLVPLTSLGPSSTDPFWLLFHPCLEKPTYLRAYSESMKHPQMGKLCFMQKCVGFDPGGVPDHPKPPAFRKITACLEEVLLGGWGAYWTLVIYSEDPAKCR